MGIDSSSNADGLRNDCSSIAHYYIIVMKVEELTALLMRKIMGFSRIRIMVDTS